MLDAQNLADDPNPPTFIPGSVDRLAYTVGDKVVVRYSISDPDGVSSVMLSPTSIDPAQAGQGNNDNHTRVYGFTGDKATSEASWDVYSDEAPGRRWVVRVKVTDKAGYVTTFLDSTYAAATGKPGPTADMSAMTYEILEAEPDPNPPTFTPGSVDRPAYTVGDKVVVRYELSEPDGITEVRLITTSVDPAKAGSLGSGTSWIANSKEDNLATETSWTVRSIEELGRRWVVGIEIHDKACYINTIWDSTYAAATGKTGPTADMSAMTYEILEAEPDPNPPTFTPGSVDRPAYTVGDKVVVRYELSEPDGISDVMLYMATVDPTQIGPRNSGVIEMNFVGDKEFAAGKSWIVNSTEEPGRRWLVGVRVTDKAGHVTTFWDSTYAAAKGEEGPTVDMSAITYMLVHPDLVPLYSVVSGDNALREAGSGEPLVVRFDGPADKFGVLELDEKLVPRDKYWCVWAARSWRLHPTMSAH